MDRRSGETRDAPNAIAALTSAGLMADLDRAFRSAFLIRLRAAEISRTFTPSDLFRFRFSFLDNGDRSVEDGW